MAELRKRGYVCAVVERWVPGQNVRKDLWGCGDVLAVSAMLGQILLVQCTSASNVSARLKKATASSELAVWLKAGGLFEVWGWSKRAGLWQVRRVPVTECKPMIRLARQRRGDRQRVLFGEG